MRITCPGCGSVFDVPDRAVPEPGRDVQCASCGTSWFLLKGAVARPEAAVAARTGVETGPQRAPVATDGAAGPDAGAAAADPHPQRRVAPEVLAILRAEAETERHARQRAAAARQVAKPAANPKHDDPGTGGSAGRGAGDGSDGATHGASSGAVESSDLSSVPRSRAGTHPGQDAMRPATGETRPLRHAVQPDPSGIPGARDRLARLTAAERRRPGPGGGQTGSDGTTGMMGTRHGDEDHGLVEDPGAALRDPQPPILGDLPLVPSRSVSYDSLPATVLAQDQRALLVLRGRRRGFRLGFGTTVGACCGALGLYLLALNAGDQFDGALADAVRTQGAHLQAALADWLRRVVAPALS